MTATAMNLGDGHLYTLYRPFRSGLEGAAQW